MLQFAIVLAVLLSSPKHGVMFDSGPILELNPNGSWTVSSKVRYSYDAACQFKELRVELIYIKIKDGKESRHGGTLTVPDEAAIGKRGYFSTTSNVAAPDGEMLIVKAALVVTHPQKGEKEWTAIANVPAPSK
jgi:hypothetical protein